MIDSEEEARKEAEELRKWNEEQKRKREEEARRQEESASVPVAAGTESTTSSARDTPVEAMEAEETPAPKERYRIPKKSAKETVAQVQKEREQDLPSTSRDAPGPSGSRDVQESSGSFRDEMLPADAPLVVRPKTKKETQVTFAEGGSGEITTLSRESDSQFVRDLAVQWEMIEDTSNPARRPWKWNLTEPQRKEWMRTKPIQSEYSRPRESARRIDEHHVPVTTTPTYISKKWKDSLDQAGYENFYPLVSNGDHDEQLPARYSNQVRKECGINLETT